MMQRKPSILEKFDKRQKIVAVILAMVLIFIIWQVIDMFKGPATPAAIINQTAQNNAKQPMPADNMMVPKPAQLNATKEQNLTPEQDEMQKQQLALQQKYVETLNELQMLKLARDIAEVNQAIASTKLATVTAEKNIIDLLAPPPPPAANTYAQGLVNPQPVASGSSQVQQAPPATIVAPAEVSYQVVSITQIQGRWNAVIGTGGKLYNASVGDVLPSDGSRVIDIDRSGVVIEKGSIQKKLSLVPII
jgi:type IV pilus biogenesis protein PilP